MSFPFLSVPLFKSNRVSRWQSIASDCKATRNTFPIDSGCHRNDQASFILIASETMALLRTEWIVGLHGVCELTPVNEYASRNQRPGPNGRATLKLVLRLIHPVSLELSPFPTVRL